MSKVEQKAKTPIREQTVHSAEKTALVPDSMPDLFGGSALAPLGDSSNSQLAMLKRLPPTQQQRMLQRVGMRQGNRHVARLVAQLQSRSAPPSIQTKLTVNEPDDAYEQEADAVADQVMRKSAPPVTNPPPDDGDPNLFRKLNTLPIQREATDPLAGAPVTSDIESRVNGLQGRGEPLPNETRTFMEDRIGADFGDVRVHRDANSADLSRDLNARAFTVGNNIAFNRGEYNPNTSEGKHLLAHELTHTVQQGAAGQLERKPLVQREADTSAETTDEPTEEEKAAAQAKAAAALAAAGGVKSESQGNTAASQGQANTEKAAAAAPKAISDASRAEGAIQEAGKQALEQQSAEKATAQIAAGEAMKGAADDKAAAAQQAAQAVVKPEGVPTMPQQQMPPAPTGDNLEGATATAQQSVAGAFEKAANAPDKAPSSAEQDPGYTTTKQAAVKTGEQQRAHDPADGEANEAQAAAVSPESELKGQAQSAQVGDMEQAETPGFDEAAFKAKLMEKIAALAPQSADEADNLKESGKVDALKGDLQNEAQSEKEKSEKPLEDKSQAQPDMSKAKPKEVTPLKSAEAGQSPASIGAENAAPKQKGTGEVETPVQESNAAVEQQMADADITEEQLANSNEPEFTGALEAKDQAKTQTEASAQTFRQAEQGQIASAEAEAMASAQAATQTMFATRTTALTGVQGEQEQTKTEDEKAREKVANDINGIYEKTKTKVDSILSALDGKVTALFDDGAKKAADAFENYVDKRMEAYKEERYGGWLGWAKWAKDKLAGMPGEVNVFYTEGRKLYIDKMDAVIDNVVALIGKTLAEAKAEVANGKREIQQYVDQLPENLKEVGNQATQEIQSKFDTLEQDIDAKQNELIDTLAQKYNENLQAIDSRIEEMKAANKGLIDQVIDKVGGVIKTIIELKNMLLSVLNRAADAIKNIIADPIGFLSNLISAVKQGLQNFLSNIGDHLKKGLIGWLTGTMANAGIQIPETFDLKGIFSLVMQVAGVGFEQIIGKLSAKLGVDLNAFIDPVMQVIDIYQEGGLAGLAKFGLGKLIGEENVQALMEVVEIVKMVLSGNFGALWERIKEYLSDLKEMVMGKIMEFVTNEVVKQGIMWVMSLFNPAGAFIKACKMIYDVVMFFVNNGKQIMALVNSVIDSVSAIASGNLGAASAAIEQALANSIPAAIGFLSSLLGLGNIPAKIREIIQSVRGFIDSAIDKFLNLPPIQMVLGFIKQLIDKVKTLVAAGVDKVKGTLGLGGGDNEGAKEKAKARVAEETQQPFSSEDALKQKVGGIEAELQPQGLQSLTVIQKPNETGQYDVIARQPDEQAADNTPVDAGDAQVGGATPDDFPLALNDEVSLAYGQTRRIAKVTAIADDKVTFEYLAQDAVSSATVEKTFEWVKTQQGSGWKMADGSSSNKSADEQFQHLTEAAKKLITDEIAEDVKTAPDKATALGPPHKWIAVFATTGKQLQVQKEGSYEDATIGDLLEQMNLGQSLIQSYIGAAIDQTVGKPTNPLELQEYLTERDQVAAESAEYIFSSHRKAFLITPTSIPRNLTVGSGTFVKTNGSPISQYLHEASVAKASTDARKSFGDEVHHIIPIALGGAHHLKNLIKVKGGRGDDIRDSAHKGLHAVFDEKVDTAINLYVKDEAGDPQAVTLDSLNEQSLRHKVEAATSLNIVIGTLLSDSSIEYRDTNIPMPTNSVP